MVGGGAAVAVARSESVLLSLGDSPWLPAKPVRGLFLLCSSAGLPKWPQLRVFSSNVRRFEQPYLRRRRGPTDARTHTQLAYVHGALLSIDSAIQGKLYTHLLTVTHNN